MAATLLDGIKVRFPMDHERSVRMLPWEKTLTAFLTAAGDRATWMLVGSAATRLHGAPIDPGDIDILFHPETPGEAMFEIAASLESYTAGSSPSDDPALFLSTVDQPFVALEDWLFGRWFVEGFKLELARIRIDVGPNIVLETLGPAVWEFRQTVSWHGEPVPVVPLEIQLSTIVSRGQTARRQAVEQRLAERGADHDLIARAAHDRGLA